jgi:rhodanese-related sulfurtransferase
MDKRSSKMMKRLITFLITCCIGFGIWLGSGSLLSAFALSVDEKTDSPPQTLPEIVVPPSSSIAVVHELKRIPQGFYGILDIDVLKTKLEREPVVLVDVRQPSEYSRGHIPGAINIPLRELGDNLDRIPGDRPVILYCSTGYRTGIGVMALHLLGYDNVQGFPPSYEGWKQSKIVE